MPTLPQPVPQMVVHILPLGQEMRAYPGPTYGARQDPNMIEMDDGARQRPNLIGMDDEDKTIATYFALEHLRTKRVVLYTTT
jgi:hypothetical protein